MKLLFTFFSLFLMVSCASQKTNKNVPSLNTENTLKHMPLNISYEARTRGNAVILHVLENTITYKTNKEEKSLKLTSDNKKDIYNILDKLDIDTMKNLKAPTNKRMFDGAMIAVLKIYKNEKEYSSANFDHGNAPKELQSLVDVLMTIVN